MDLPRDRKSEGHVGDKGSGFSADDVSSFILDFVLEDLMPSFWLCLRVCTSAKSSGVKWSSSTAVLLQLVVWWAKDF